MTTQTPTRYRFTVAQYHRLGETGVLSAEDRVELIEGGLVAMAPMGSWHAYIVNRLNELLVLGLAGRAFVTVQSPLVLGNHSEPEPDILLLRPPASRYRDALPVAADVALLIEVSDTTAHYDHNTKLPLYAHHGIPEVWVVERDPRQVMVYREPNTSEGSYRNIRTVSASTLSPGAFPAVGVDLDSLF